MSIYNFIYKNKLHTTLTQSYICVLPGIEQWTSDDKLADVSIEDTIEKPSLQRTRFGAFNDPYFQCNRHLHIENCWSQFEVSLCIGTHTQTATVCYSLLNNSIKGVCKCTKSKEWNMFSLGGYNSAVLLNYVTMTVVAKCVHSILLQQSMANWYSEWIMWLRQSVT